MKGVRLPGEIPCALLLDLSLFVRTAHVVGPWRGLRLLSPFLFFQAGALESSFGS